MHRLSITLALILIATLSVGAFASTSAGGTDSIEQHISHLKLKPEKLRALIDKEVIVRSLSTNNDKEMAALGVVLVDATPEGFIDSYRSLATFKQSNYILACGKFSANPSAADMEALKIDDADLLALLRSSAGDSEIKLSDAEITRLRAVSANTARLTPQLKARLATEFKKLMAERVRTYLARGAAGLDVYVDKEEPVSARESLGGLIQEQKESARHCEHLYSQLESYPQDASPESESFVYWAKQKFGDLKPVFNIIHVLIHKCGGRVYISSSQIYSTHYTNAGITVAEFIPFKDNAGQSCTIVIYNLRLEVDMLGGTLGFIKRRMAQPKVLATLKQSLSGMRMNMEELSRLVTNNRTGS